MITIDTEIGKKVKNFLDTLYKSNPEKYDEVLATFEHLDKINAPAADYEQVMGVNDFRNVNLSADPLANGQDSTNGKPNVYWKNLSDDELYRNLGADPTLQVHGPDGYYDSTRFANIKKSMQDNTDRIVRKREVDDLWYNNPLTRMLAPHQMEELYSRKPGESMEPSWKNLGLDLAFLGLEAAPFAIPGGAIAKSVGGVLGAALGYIGANAAAPLIEETLDQMSDNVERQKFNLGDVLTTTGINMVMPKVLQKGGQLAKNLFKPEKTVLKGASNFLETFGVDPAEVARNAEKKLSTDVNNFNTFNPASPQNIAPLNTANYNGFGGKELIDLETGLPVGKAPSKPFDDPRIYREADANYNIDGNSEFVPLAKPTPKGVDVPTVEQFQDAYDQLQLLGAIKDGKVKYNMYGNTPVLEVPLDAKPINVFGTEIPKYSDDQQLLKRLYENGIIPPKSISERAAKMAPATLITNKLGQQKYASMVQGYDPSTMIPVETAPEFMVEDGNNIGLITGATRSFNKRHDDSVIDELIAENADNWEAGFRPWVGFKPQDENDILVRAYRKWASDRAKRK